MELAVGEGGLAPERGDPACGPVCAAGGEDSAEEGGDGRGPGECAGAERGMPGTKRGRPCMASGGCACRMCVGATGPIGTCSEAASSSKKSRLDAVSSDRSGKVANGKIDSSNMT
jgi:hypothetical protein